MSDQRFFEVLGIGPRVELKPPEEIIKWAETIMWGSSPRLIFVFAIDEEGARFGREGDDEMLLAQLQDLRSFYSTPGAAHYVIRSLNDADALLRIAYNIGPYGMIFVMKGLLMDDKTILSLDCVERIRNLLVNDWFRDKSSFFAAEPYEHSVYADKVEAGEFGRTKPQ